MNGLAKESSQAPMTSRCFPRTVVPVADTLAPNSAKSDRSEGASFTSCTHWSPPTAKLRKT